MSSPAQNEEASSLAPESDLGTHHSNDSVAASSDQHELELDSDTAMSDDFPTVHDDLVEEPESVNNIFQLLGGRLVGGPMGGGMMGGREPPQETLSAALKALNPWGNTLGLSDIESCVKLESLAASPERACTREQLSYHLNAAGELSYGLFSSATPAAEAHSADTAQTGKPADSFAPERKAVLLGQMICTKTSNSVVNDEDCMLPASAGLTTEVTTHRRGHNEAGRTLAVQSFAVLPHFQGKGVGRVLMKAYLQRMSESDIADRVAVLVDPEHVAFFEKMGFQNLDVSSAKRANGRQVNMICDFTVARARSEEY